MENYTLWSRAMQLNLLTKNKLGFIDGSIKRDDFKEELEKKQWVRCNAMVISWIMCMLALCNLLVIILMHQRKYALGLISDLGLGSSKPIDTPVEQNQKLTTHEFDDFVGNDSDSPLLDVSEYQRLIGRLLYLTLTRPDISYAVQSLSQFMQAPKTSHMTAAIRIVKYVKQSPGLGVLLSATSSGSLQAFCDADWGSCINTRRSITGYIVKYGDSPISWKSKKQSTISRSSAEAEYRSLASTVAEITWIIGLFNTLDIPLSLPVPLHCDSKAAIQIAANPVFHERTKHIDIDCHFIREKVLKGFVIIHYLCSSEQPADLFTKGLSRCQHSHLMSKLGLKNIFISPSLKGDIGDYNKEIAKS